MQWTGEPGSGFSSATPWIAVNPNHVWLNASAQRADPDSIYHYYRRLIALRHTEPVVTDGDFELIAGPDAVYAFRRCLGTACLEIYANLSDTAVSLEGVELELDRILLGNYREDRRESALLAPWEVRTYRR